MEQPRIRGEIHRFNLNLNVNLNFNVNVNLNANWPDGIDEQKAQRRCRIYPNPTRGTLHIITNDEKIRSVSAVSALGQPISLRPHGNTVTLDALPSGVYTLTVITNMNTYQQKIIKL